MTDIVALPNVDLMRAALPLGWGLVMAYLGMALMQRSGAPRSMQRKPGVRGLIVVLTLAWMFLPAGLSPAYWLGLAFQMPSLTTMVLCAGGLWNFLGKPPGTPTGTHASQWRDAARWITLAGVLLGWALLLDTFGLLPMALYAWGFDALPVGVLGVVAVLPWLSGRAVGWQVRFAIPLALSAFVVFRLPTGNVFDAVMDPWLWLYLHWRLMRPAK